VSSAAIPMAAETMPPAAARRWQANAGVAGVLGLLALLPLLSSGYWTFTLGLCFANAIAIISVSFLVRYAGEVSIGHGLTADALEYGMAETVRRFLKACGW